MYNTINTSTKQLTVLGLMSAITALMVFTPVGMIPTPGGTSLTISHIPTILTAVLFGPVMGGIVGFVFGVSSLLRALSAASPFDLMFLNPLVSVLPRVLFGLGTGYLYLMLSKVASPKGESFLRSKWRTDIRLIVSAAGGSFIHTTLVLGMMFLVYHPFLMELTGGNLSTVAVVLAGIAATAGLLEMVTAAVIVLPVAKALKRAFSL